MNKLLRCILPCLPIQRDPSRPQSTLGDGTLLTTYSFLPVSLFHSYTIHSWVTNHFPSKLFTLQFLSQCLSLRKQAKKVYFAYDIFQIKIFELFLFKTLTSNKVSFVLRNLLYSPSNLLWPNNIVLSKLESKVDLYCIHRR